MKEVSRGFGGFFGRGGLVLVADTLLAGRKRLPWNDKGLTVTLLQEMNCINPCPSPLYLLPTENNNRITKIPHSLMGW